MNSISELAKSRARINRARDNINEFGKTLSQYLDQHPAKISVNVGQYGQGTVKVVRHEPIPVELSILLGEALQNLRGGLDNCLYAVAIIDSGENPPPGAEKLQWPIAVTPKEWRDNRGRLKYLSPHLVTVLHRIQPFQADRPELNCLQILHDLARIDRHRAAHELAMWPETVKGTFDKKVIRNLKINEGPLSDEGIVVTFTQVGSDELSPALIDLQFEFDIDVRDVELVPSGKTGRPSRPWGSLDNRLKAMCLAAEEYAEGLVEIAQNQDLLLPDE